MDKFNAPSDIRGSLVGLTGGQSAEDHLADLRAGKVFPENNIPPVFYECADQICAELQTWPASALRWFRGMSLPSGRIIAPGFYCMDEECAGMGYEVGWEDRVLHRGQSLQMHFDAEEMPAGENPRPMYPCATPSCAEFYTWPADSLVWFEGWRREDGSRIPRGFYCIEGSCGWEEDWTEPLLEAPIRLRKMLVGKTLAEHLLSTHVEEPEGEEADD